MKHLFVTFMMIAAGQLYVYGQSKPEIDAGIVASNEGLCRLIKWDSPDRALLSRQFVALKQAEKAAIAMADPDRYAKEIGELVQSYEKSISTIDIAKSRSKIALGLCALRGSYAIATGTLMSELDIADSQNIANMVSIQNKSISKIVKDSIERNVYTSHERLLSIVEDAIKDRDADLRKQLEMHLAPKAFSKLRVILNEADKIDLKEKYSDIKRIVLHNIINEVDKSGITFYKNELEIPQSYLLFANSQTVARLLDLSQELQNDLAIQLLSLTSKTKEVVSMYNNVDSNKKKDIKSAHSFFSGVLASEFKKYDVALSKTLGKKEARLRQIHQQMAGPSVLFLDFTSGKDDFSFTSFQRQEQQKLFSSLSRDLSRITGDKDLLKRRAELTRKFNINIYKTIFTEEQRKRWDRDVGEQISDDLLAEIYVEYFSIKKSIAK